MGEHTWSELTMSTYCACGVQWHTKTLQQSGTPPIRRFETCPVCLPDPEGDDDE